MNVIPKPLGKNNPTWFDMPFHSVNRTVADFQFVDSYFIKTNIQISANSRIVMNPYPFQ